MRNYAHKLGIYCEQIQKFYFMTHDAMWLRKTRQ